MDEPIASLRLWRMLRRIFLQAALAVEKERPPLAEKLRRASPHWLRHTHASHAIAAGAELVAVRDNLRHTPITTTPRYRTAMRSGGRDNLIRRSARPESIDTSLLAI